MALVFNKQSRTPTMLAGATLLAAAFTWIAGQSQGEAQEAASSSTSPSLPGRIVAPAVAPAVSGVYATPVPVVPGTSSLTVPGAGPGVASFYGALAGGRHRSSLTAEQRKTLAKAIQDLKSEELDRRDKEAAQNEIEDILSAQFDADLEHRQEQVENLEKQIETLKDQIAKRRDAKQRLIELRLELLINESEGLGFPSAWNVLSTSQPTITTGSAFGYRPTYSGTLKAPAAPANPASRSRNGR